MGLLNWLKKRHLAHEISSGVIKHDQRVIENDVNVLVNRLHWNQPGAITPEMFRVAGPAYAKVLRDMHGIEGDVLEKSKMINLQSHKLHNKIKDHVEEALTMEKAALKEKNKKDIKKLKHHAYDLIDDIKQCKKDIKKAKELIIKGNIRQAQKLLKRSIPTRIDGAISKGLKFIIEHAKYYQVKVINDATDRLQKELEETKISSIMSELIKPSYENTEISGLIARLELTIDQKQEALDTFLANQTIFDKMQKKTLNLRYDKEDQKIQDIVALIELIMLENLNQMVNLRQLLQVLKVDGFNNKQLIDLIDVSQETNRVLYRMRRKYSRNT